MKAGEITYKDGDKVLVFSGTRFIRVVCAEAEALNLGDMITYTMNDDGYAMNVLVTAVSESVKKDAVKKETVKEVAASIKKPQVGDLVTINTAIEARYSGYGSTPVIWVPMGSTVRLIHVEVTPVRGTKTYMIAEFFVEGMAHQQSVKIYGDQIRSITRDNKTELTTIINQTGGK